MPVDLDVLIPTFSRPSALAVTLAGLAAQDWRHFRVIVSSQDEDEIAPHHPEVRTMVGVLREHGHDVDVQQHLPRRGLAEHRQSLLDQVTAPYALFLDDDVYLEPPTIGRLMDAIRRMRCGFVGSAPIGLTYAHDERPHEQELELWEAEVTPERVEPGGLGWQRHRLHNAANILHAARNLGLGPAEYRLYRVAWVGGCVLYDTQALREAGGFGFWSELPPVHAGEDVLAQLRVMARRGGAGLIPSGAYHLELPTTVPDRTHDAPALLGV
jgi:GT2 family glycosyltransferase